MPTYCFTTKDGQIIERHFPSDKVPKRIKVGKTWALRNYVVEHRSVLGGERGWPIRSEALAIHPDQVAEFQKFDAASGVPTQYTPDGRPILTGKKHRKDYCKLHGYYDRNAGYGDPVPENRR